MFRTKIDEKVENEIADSLVLTFTPNGTIDKLPKELREEKFKDKAKLINRRIRVLKQLDLILKSKENQFTEQHKKKLKQTLIQAKILFGALDAIRRVPFFIKNPYRK